MQSNIGTQDINYEWNRFWCPRDGVLDLSDGGFLRSPLTHNRALSQVLSFSEINNHHALVLLGEPGIGKSNEIWRASEVLRLEDSDVEKFIVLLDLERCRDHLFLKNSLLNSEKFKTWRKGTGKLFIFFDNFERIGIPPHLFAEDISEALSEFSLENLYIRIASRTFDWSIAVEKKLQSFFRTDVAVYELAPLAKTDVELAAASVLGDSNKFVADIIRADIVPLAISPITLRFLLNSYLRNRMLPSTASDLYKLGLEILCEESNTELREARSIGVLSPKNLLAVASRIAAIMVLSNRYAIWTNSDHGKIPDEDIKLTDFEGGKESFESTEIPVDMSALRDTLGTGLFSSRGPHRFGFTHQSYAEYLAAVFFKERNVSPNQLLNLLINSEDPDRRVIPQLTAVAAWIASRVPNVFDVIVKTDPHALLSGDLEKLTDAERKRIVDSFFNLLRDEKISVQDIRHRYQKLNHAELSNQIEKIILNQAEDIIVRREALRIAAACGLTSLNSHFIKIALNLKEPNEVRQFAGLALIEINDPTFLPKLLPLALGLAGSDPEDELKGLALKALFPSHISTQKLFEILTPAKDPNYFGAYQYFLTYLLPARLTISDLPFVLDWIRKTDLRKNNVSFSSREERFSDNLMWTCWKQCDRSDIAELFANIVLARLLKFDQPVGSNLQNQFQDSLREETTRRRLLVKYLVQIGSRKRKVSIYDVANAIRCVLFSDDFCWLVDEIMKEKSSRNRKLFVQLAKLSFDCSAEHSEALLVKAENELDLQSEFAWIKKIYTLGSPEALREKERYERSHYLEEKKLLNPPPTERISSLLDIIENGKPNLWCNLIRELTLEADSTVYGDVFDREVTDYPGWKAADEDGQKRIIKAATFFLQDPSCDPKINEWLCTDNLNWLAIAGVQALQLIKTQNLTLFSELDDEVWKRFFGNLLLYPDLGNSNQRDNKLILLKYAYSRVPEAITEAIKTRIRFDNSDSKRISMLTGISEILDDPLALKLQDLLEDEELELQLRGDILRLLLGKKVESARRFSKTLLNSRTKDDLNNLVIIAATGLVTNWAEYEWSEIWQMILKDEKFGDALLEEIASWWQAGHLISHLSDDDLVELYLWMYDRYPAPPKTKELVKRMSLADMLHDFRIQIPNYISARGTLSAASALAKIIELHPELIGLHSMKATCLAKFRKTTWIPYSPQLILNFLNDSNSRLVSSERDLMNVILDSLERLQVELKDFGAIAEQLWNAIPISYLNKVSSEEYKGGKHDKIYTPRDEEAFCNFVAAHLKRDLTIRGIVINREVQIRVNPGAKGERTDIHVDAIAKSGQSANYERLSVVIEAKGSWNSEIDTAMESQLVDQYLKESACQSGIYLIGYFNCPQWDSADYRKSVSERYNLNDLNSLLHSQALNLSDEPMSVIPFILDASLKS